MTCEVEVRKIAEQPLAVVRGLTTMATLPVRIRALFDEFYAGFKGKGGLNVVLYPPAAFRWKKAGTRGLRAERWRGRFIGVLTRK